MALLTDYFLLHGILRRNTAVFERCGPLFRNPPSFPQQSHWGAPRVSTILTFFQTTTLYWYLLAPRDEKMRRNYRITIREQEQEIQHQLLTRQIAPHAAASAIHSCRNRTLLMTRQHVSAPALLISTIQKPILQPLEAFEEKYAWRFLRRKFIELSDDDKEEVSPQLSPLLL